MISSQIKKELENEKSLKKRFEKMKFTDDTRTQKKRKKMISFVISEKEKVKFVRHMVKNTKKRFLEQE